MTVQSCQPGLECDFVLSGLPSAIAEETELELAKAGMPVLSNASSHRMKADVPLLIPEINPDHLECSRDAEETDRQPWDSSSRIRTARLLDWCSHWPRLHRKFGVEAVTL